MPGIARARKPRISASKETRSGVAIVSPRRNASTRSCSSPATPTVAASANATKPASARATISAIMTAIKAALNSSGENAVTKNRPCALASASSTVAGPGKGEIGQHQPGVGDRKLQRVMPGKSRRQHRHEQRHDKTEQRGRDDQGGADGAEHGAREACCRGRARAFHAASSMPAPAPRSVRLPRVAAAPR